MLSQVVCCKVLTKFLVADNVGSIKIRFILQIRNWSLLVLLSKLRNLQRQRMQKKKRMMIGLTMKHRKVRLKRKRKICID